MHRNNWVQTALNSPSSVVRWCYEPTTRCHSETASAWDSDSYARGRYEHSDSGWYSFAGTETLEASGCASQWWPLSPSFPSSCHPFAGTENASCAWDPVLVTSRLQHHEAAIDETLLAVYLMMKRRENSTQL